MLGVGIRCTPAGCGPYIIWRRRKRAAGEQVRFYITTVTSRIHQGAMSLKHVNQDTIHQSLTRDTPTLCSSS